MPFYKMNKCVQMVESITLDKQTFEEHIEDILFRIPEDECVPKNGEHSSSSPKFVHKAYGHSDSYCGQSLENSESLWMNTYKIETRDL